MGHGGRPKGCPVGPVNAAVDRPGTPRGSHGRCRRPHVSFAYVRRRAGGTNSMVDADPGLFGPESVTWQMHGDPMMWIAGVRALYLQALHPRAVRGVMQNSDFRSKCRPLSALTCNRASEFLIK
ncbi:oxygenase MpaB family protein [Streptomyces sp. NPDC059802]|uniref:oxygenase MpaB family protein n=1 Tax=Streptomyces sp. NPDC059802 TaxID=3346952 RepID=UPI003653E6BF